MSNFVVVQFKKDQFATVKPDEFYVLPIDTPRTFPSLEEAVEFLASVIVTGQTLDDVDVFRLAPVAKGRKLAALSRELLARTVDMDPRDIPPYVSELLGEDDE